MVPPGVKRWCALLGAIPALALSAVGQPVALRDAAELHTTLLQNPGFTMGYSEFRRQALWVSFEAEQPPRNRRYRRAERFESDPRSRNPVRYEDYIGSHYDRGHLAPAYLIAKLYGSAAQQAAQLMSNVSPQLPRLNQLLWQRIEEVEADLVPRRIGAFTVYTGPVFGRKPARLRSGVHVPVAFYRVWFTEQPARAAAFLVPQEVCGAEALSRFLVTVDAVERATGLDFLRELENRTEEMVESAPASADWRITDFADRSPRYADKFAGQACSYSGP